MPPLLLHSSRRTKDATHRRVLHFEYARLEELDSRLQWNLAATRHDAQAL